MTRCSWRKETVCIPSWALCHFPPPTSVHFHGLSKVFWVFHCLSYLRMCLPHFRRTQYLVTPSSCHLGVHLQAAPSVDFKSARAPLWFLRPWVFILPAFVWSCPFLCPSAEHDPLLIKKSPPFLFLPLPPVLLLWINMFVLLQQFKHSSQFFHFISFSFCFQHTWNSTLMQLLGFF